MMNSYAKIAWRSLIKQPSNSIINILGLTAGTTICLAIMLFTFSQNGYDGHHENSEDIYRVRTVLSSNDGGEDWSTATASPPIAFGMKNDFPEVEEACRIVFMESAGGSLIRKENSVESFYQQNGYMADSTLFKIFNFSFTEGSAQSALSGPNTVVLSTEVADKLFLGENAMGNTIIIGDGESAQLLTVTGVFKSNHAKSHLSPDYVISMNTPGLGEFVRNNDQWAGQNFVYNYVRLTPGANASNLEAKLPAFLQRHGAEDLNEANSKKELFLQNVEGIHLHSDGISNQIGTVSSQKYLTLLLTLAFFIQLVACINFVNLSTARSNQRAREIGVRKVMGADKSQLIFQFLNESLLLSFAATLLAFPTTYIALPLLNQLTSANIDVTEILDSQVILSLTALGAATGLLAGIFPAVYLSSAQPSRIIRGLAGMGKETGTLRKALVVFQFVVSILLIFAVVVINKQIEFTRKKDLGFDRNNHLIVHLKTSKARENYKVLKSEFSAISGISNVTGSEFFPAQRVLYDYGIRLNGKPDDQRIIVKVNLATEEYFTSMNIPLLRGRNLRPGDENQVVVNQTLLKTFDLDLDQAEGTKLFSIYEGETEEFEIVGVSKDYHFASLKEPIEPLMTFYTDQPNSILIPKGSFELDELVAEVETKWSKILPDVPFTYSFLDQEVSKLYFEEEKAGKLSTVFTGLAVFISCLGLFGLVSFTAEQRRKEIGIRKVLGAHVLALVTLLSKDFVLLVILAFIITVPIAWWMMDSWLQDFEYHIQLQWWMFAFAGAGALVVALITVSFQGAKAAMANPVKSLRTE